MSRSKVPCNFPRVFDVCALCGKKGSYTRCCSRYSLGGALGQRERVCRYCHHFPVVSARTSHMIGLYVERGP